MNPYDIRVLAEMPASATVYGCLVCAVYWANHPICWMCNTQGALIANAATKSNLLKQAYTRISE